MDLHLKWRIGSNEYETEIKQELVEVTKTPKTPFNRINIDIFEFQERNYCLPKKEELTKLTHAYGLETASSLTFF